METIGGHGRWSSDKCSVFAVSEYAKVETIGDHRRCRFETGTTKLYVETIGGHGRWSSDKCSVFLIMPRWRPWESIGGGGVRQEQAN